MKPRYLIKKESKVNWPIIISLSSLLISALTFLITNYANLHSIKVTFITTDATIKNDTLYNRKKLIIQNYGKQTESILKITAEYHDENTEGRSYEASFPITDRDSAFILKPGEIIIKSFAYTIKLDSVIIKKIKVDHQNVEQSFSFTLTNSKEIKYKVLPRVAVFDIFRQSVGIMDLGSPNFELCE